MSAVLDHHTVRACAKRLEERAEALRKFHERKGWGPNHHFIGRAAELESMADVLLSLPSLQEQSRRAASLTRALSAVVAGPAKKRAKGGGR